MRHLKLLLVGVSFIMSSAVYANTAHKLTNPNSITSEIENLIQESCLQVDAHYTVTVFFSVSDDQKIQSLSVASSNEEINHFLQKKLENKELPGEFWRTGKIYEISVILS